MEIWLGGVAAVAVASKFDNPGFLAARTHGLDYLRDAVVHLTKNLVALRLVVFS